MCKNAKIYQASSSEMFGNSIDEDRFQRENTPMNPVSPYGCAKVFAYNITRNYRNSYGMYVSNGILFNHESPRRGTNFVTNKVVKEAVKIFYGQSTELRLGNLEATRDWGHAKDYVEAMWRILQLEEPNDFVCATGVSHSVKELCEYVFTNLGLNYEDYVKLDMKFLRPEELTDLKGDPTKLMKATGWKPTYTFETMLDEMIIYWKHELNKVF
jgi:GDPmannose 4,6-dehydratase